MTACFRLVPSSTTKDIQARTQNREHLSPGCHNIQEEFILHLVLSLHEAADLLNPQVAESELAFGITHIFASLNDTFVYATDLSGKETITCVTSSMKAKADHDESAPHATMLAAQGVATHGKEIGLTALHIALCTTDVLNKEPSTKTCSPRQTLKI